MTVVVHTDLLPGRTVFHRLVVMMIMLIRIERWVKLVLSLGKM